jgi:hypothetical protein
MSFITHVDINARNISPNDFTGTDTQRIQAAVDYAASIGRGEIYIPRINLKTGNPLWLLDSAILLPSNMTVIMDNSLIQLSDTSRDNFFRSNNCGFGITAVTANTNIHILGIGNPVLKGALNPRATGDAGKTLSLTPTQFGSTSYGSDAGVSGQTQIGDWRGFGIYMINVNNFSIEGIKIVDPHMWAITLERCTSGRLAHLDFSSTGSRIVSGTSVWSKNQDGIDIKRGCQDIVVKGIVGRTGDDCVALATINVSGETAGQYGTQSLLGGLDIVLSGDDIYNVTVRDIKCATDDQNVRLLNTGTQLRIYNVFINGVLDNAGTGTTQSAVIIGDTGFGGIAPVGNTSRIFISNILTKAAKPIRIVGSLSESVINNVVRYDSSVSAGTIVFYESGTGNTRNLSITNVFDYTV